MTLATVPRYDSDRTSERRGRAVVAGAGMAGLLAARVLADEFEAVTVLDRDSLADEVTPRRGVPQGRHPHALLEAGRATLEDLFPGYGEDLVSAGGVVVDFASDVNFYDEGDFLAHGPVRMETYSASRPLIEQIARQHVADLDGVRLRPHCRFVDYCSDRAHRSVEGVVVRENGDRTEIPADLVVDATGRTSRTPTWLADHGYAPPTVDEVRIDLAYSTAYVERPASDRRTYLVPPSSPRTRGGMAAPVEGDRWVVNLQGVHGTTPPTEFAAFAEYAAGLPTPVLKRLLDDHPTVSETVEYYPFPSNRRHRYEGLDRFPEGLVVVGDALASFNPVYAQGISVAALEALVLHRALVTGGRRNLAFRFFDRAEDVVDVAWMLAAGSDFRFPQTIGPEPRGTELVARYLSRLTRRAHTDGALAEAFVRVLSMERPPVSLFRPNVLWRVFGPAT
ncbi:FAD-dependent oxidoreductase [Halorussus aquaticus]|uniref:FAD-dependent oxidoreductase n=1 Tax=Halorussus aquaticus TaxID=2953748 RepID=A0ABD5PX13_9EURY|nr:oxidoreductase [Halorussus aquaticus]